MATKNSSFGGKFKLLSFSNSNNHNADQYNNLRLNASQDSTTLVPSIQSNSISFGNQQKNTGKNGYCSLIKGEKKKLLH